MVSFPGETTDYRTARKELLDQEKELRRSIERVAAARRALPPGGILEQDYVFQHQGDDGQPIDIAFSELFSPGKDALAVYSFMFSPDMDQPCPGCTSLLDGLDGAAYHANQRIDFWVEATSPFSRIVAFADGRWRNLRLVSSAGTTYRADYHGQTDDGGQQPMMNTFRRDGGVVRHVWGSELMFEESDPGQHPRHNDLVDPLWHMFDMTHIGRGDFQEQLVY